MADLVDIAVAVILSLFTFFSQNKMRKIHNKFKEEKQQCLANRSMTLNNHKRVDLI